MEKVQDIMRFCDHKPPEDLKKIQYNLEECIRKANQPLKPKLIGIIQVNH